MDAIHDKKPREIVGRDTALRFRMQFQAAAYAALEILSGKEVDRIYCDYHDDFVVRRTKDGSVEYHFFQVKTKSKTNQQWKLDEIFNLKKTGEIDTEEKINAIRNSIAGKLFAHTMEFGDLCREVTILSNVHFQDDIYCVIDDLKDGKSNKKYINRFIEKFSDIFSQDSPLSEDDFSIITSKFSLAPNVQYIGGSCDVFADAARNEIWKHSEIDLRRHEVDEIANSLVNLIMSKSCTPIEKLSKCNIDFAVSVGLEDLLNVLSISTKVYQNLLAGDDPAVIKASSILQRQLKYAGASENMIETASQLKVAWDIWLRTARHTFPDFEVSVLLDNIDKKCTSWILSGGSFVSLKSLIKEMDNDELHETFPLLNIDLIFGGFCASIVRRAAR